MSRILVATRLGAPGSVYGMSGSPPRGDTGSAYSKGTSAGRVEGRLRAVLVGQYARNGQPTETTQLSGGGRACAGRRGRASGSRAAAEGRPAGAAETEHRRS